MASAYGRTDGLTDVVVTTRNYMTLSYARERRTQS
jgi:hypothetical protein